MLFNSFQFLFVFFPIVTGLYFVLPHRHRWWLLLGASAYFYMAFVPKYILILVALILLDFTMALLIERASDRRRRMWLALSLVANISILAVFKYFNFVNENLAALAHLLGGHWGLKNLGWLLPLGLSFHTFQSMAYTIEVYRGNQPAERHLGYYALYVMYYPQLVAGPIERPQNLLPQFRSPVSFDVSRVASGLELMTWGLFKKVFVADRLAIVADAVYRHPALYEGWSFPYILANYFFAFQIYYDFSGYTDIARGASRVMGIELMENFRFPFSAGSVAEFWTRWHISLSTWFKDYLYLPLVYGTRTRDGAMRPELGHVFIFIVFLVSGFWHGAGWSFGLWGASHGLFIVISGVSKPWRMRVHRAVGLTRHRRLHALLRTLIAFHLIWFTWVLFRAATFADAVTVMRNIGRLHMDWPRALASYGADNDVRLGLAGILFVTAIERLQRSAAWERLSTRRFVFSFNEAFHATLLALIAVGAPLAKQAFIYFQF
jgi:D-alanyl-lipoteichoic acid acyltransferase DltB (MBOAT superfamily)